MPTTPKHIHDGSLKFAGDPNASFERHLIFDHVQPPNIATSRSHFWALSRALRDMLTPHWIDTEKAYDQKNPKQVYYLSMEFLIGRSMVNNIVNLHAEPIVQKAMAEKKLDWTTIAEQEPDAGLGNGGLGRLAACFIDSLATLQIPAIGYGLRYEFGMFKQYIVNGYQMAEPDNWLRRPDPWEVIRPDSSVQVNLSCSFELQHGVMHTVRNLPSRLMAIPWDRPVIGYGGKTVNTLRLWSAAASRGFDLKEFSGGDIVGAVHEKVAAEALTRVLYPDDSTAVGQGLRFLQEYFLVAASLADITARFRRRGNEWKTLPDKVAIQLNDTHPALAVAELMRILLDDAKLGWEEAWDLTRRTLAYTNHTLLPEALETWPVRYFETLIPRHLEIIYEINRLFLKDVAAQHPNDDARARRMSLIAEDGGPQNKKVRMAYLAVVGSHSTNGVAEIHSRLLRTSLMSEFAEMFPYRFGNKTNGVTPRRWLLMANPDLSKLITESIGDGWITDLPQLKQIAPLANDAAFRQSFGKAKRQAKTRFADWLAKNTDFRVDPDFLFDCQVKRIHEYKRQLLNILHVVMLYSRLRENPKLDVPPRAFFFAGKAAPAYTLAKLIIKLINAVAATIEEDASVRNRLRVYFLPDYNVALAERLIPAADVSEQISTAGYEASGTSNMKFMMNGALTIGTRDGATIEMAEEAGEENFFLFGLTADQVASARGWYSPWWHYNHEPETRNALDLILSNHFNPLEPGIFEPLRDTLLNRGDFYMHLADLTAYAQTHTRVGQLYQKPDDWIRKTILNVASSGKFSSDRTILEYARDIWDAKPCPT